MRGNGDNREVGAVAGGTDRLIVAYRLWEEDGSKEDGEGADTRERRTSMVRGQVVITRCREVLFLGNGSERGLTLPRSTP